MLEMLKNCFGNDALKLAAVRDSHGRFQAGCESVENYECSGRPSSSWGKNRRNRRIHSFRNQLGQRYWPPKVLRNTSAEHCGTPETEPRNNAEPPIYPPYFCRTIYLFFSQSFKIMLALANGHAELFDSRFDLRNCQKRRILSI